MMAYLMNYALNFKLLLLLCTVAATVAQTKSGCQNRCGNVTIPYPFGTSKNCYQDTRFYLNCTTTNTSSSGESETQLIYGSNIKVLNISLDPPELTVSQNVSKYCYGYGSGITWNSMWFTHFSISNTKNRFTVVGCDTYAYINDLNSTFTTGCALSCNNKTRFKEGVCSGVGCCQSSFPEAIRNSNITLYSFDDYTYVRNFNPCGYAFLAKEGTYNFSYPQDLRDLRNRTEFPVVVDWGVGNLTCDEAQKDLTNYACKENSECQDSTSGIGYYCLCKDGFRGNPYLSHPDEGCRGKPYLLLQFLTKSYSIFQVPIT